MYLREQDIMGIKSGRKNSGYNRFIWKKLYCIGGVMVSASPGVGYIVCLNPDRVKSKTIKLVFVASPLSMQH